MKSLKSTEERVEKLKKTLLDLSPRTFGSVCEKIIKIYLTKKGFNVSKSSSIHYDKKIDEISAEDKGSRVIEAKKVNLESDDFYEELLSFEKSRFLKESELSDFKWDCNIQQVKMKYFDILYYMLLCDDKVFMFKITPNEIKKDKKLAYSNKQHDGNIDEGQFHIKKTNFKHHKEKYLLETLTWEDLDKMLLNN